MKSNEVKKNLLFRFLYGRSFIFATTEMGLFDGFSVVADVVALSKKYKFYEVEVKTNITDLRGELKTVQNILEEGISDMRLAKYCKHRIYLKDPDKDNLFIPHRFYFSVPYEHKEEALSTLSKTPYGLMDLQGNVYKVARDLHKKPIQKDFIDKMLQRLSRVNYDLLEKYDKRKNIRTI
ncbi:MAG: hypothetical protein WC346_16595 [Methanogenium sp.]|jgi:hypothetical protein